MDAFGFVDSHETHRLARRARIGRQFKERDGIEWNATENKYLTKSCLFCAVWLMRENVLACRRSVMMRWKKRRILMRIQSEEEWEDEEDDEEDDADEEHRW